VRWHLIPKTVF